MNNPHPRIIRKNSVCDQTGRGKTLLHDDIKNGLMTPPVPIGLRAVGWPQHEVDAIVSYRIAGKSVEDIRSLVHRLTDGRQEMAGSF